MTIRALRMISGIWWPPPWGAATVMPASWPVTCRSPYVMSRGRAIRAAAAARRNAAPAVAAAATPKGRGVAAAGERGPGEAGGGLERQVGDDRARQGAEGALDEEGPGEHCDDGGDLATDEGPGGDAEGGQDPGPCRDREVGHGRGAVAELARRSGGTECHSQDHGVRGTG